MEFVNRFVPTHLKTTMHAITTSLYILPEKFKQFGQRTNFKYLSIGSLLQEVTQVRSLMAKLSQFIKVGYLSL